jgi:hypothetical protein
VEASEFSAVELIGESANVDNLSVTTNIPPGIVAGGDADGDGIPNEWENANGLNPLDPSDATEDHDGDGVDNRREYRRQTDPNDGQFMAVTIYVDSASGDDTHYGVHPAGFDPFGPLKTIGAAIDWAMDGDTLSVAGGIYPELPCMYDLGSKRLTITWAGNVHIE